MINDDVMELARYMEEGAKIVPVQCKERFIERDNDEQICAVCALGAVAVAITAETHGHLESMTAFSYYDYISNRIDLEFNVLDMKVANPMKMNSITGQYLVEELSQVIEYLNDHCNWPIPRIAAWLRELARK